MKDTLIVKLDSFRTSKSMEHRNILLQKLYFGNSIIRNILYKLSYKFPSLGKVMVNRWIGGRWVLFCMNF